MIKIIVSSSIANFKEKIFKRINYDGDYTLFCGLYHWVDYLRFIFSRGKKRVFWAGSDILNLNWFWAWILRRKRAEHICENTVEETALYFKRIKARVQPVILTDPDLYPVSFKPNEKPHVFICCHPGREEEYGIDVIEKIAIDLPEITFHVYGISSQFHEAWFDSQYGLMHNQTYADNPNIIYHGKVPEEEFDQQVKHYQAGLRLNKFDGFGEVLAKSILMGQYPISRIKYQHIDHFETEEELISLLRGLKNKRKPNPNREWWHKKLKERI